ncbi:MAG: hypothetical protein V5A84_00810 [Planctomycetota bacterium]
MAEKLYTGREVEFQHPYTHETRHGKVVSAGPRQVVVKDSPTTPCIFVRRADVEPVEEPEVGPAHDGPTTLHSGE